VFSDLILILVFILLFAFYRPIVFIQSSYILLICFFNLPSSTWRYVMIVG